MASLTSETVQILQAHTLKNCRAASLLLVILTACAHKPGAAVVTKPTEGGAEASEQPSGKGPASIVELMSLTLSQEGRPIARLHPDGRMQGTRPDRSGKPARFVPGPTLRADGTIILTKGGFTARIERTGDIYMVNPPGQGSREHFFGRISGTELKLANSKTWVVRIEGDTIRFNGPVFPNKIEGTLNDQSQRTALVMAAAFLIDMYITSLMVPQR